MLHIIRVNNIEFALRDGNLYKIVNSGEVTERETKLALADYDIAGVHDLYRLCHS